MKKWNKTLYRAAAACFALLLGLGSSLALHAGEDLDLSREGSIQVTLTTTNGSPVTSGSLGAYLVATPQAGEDGYEFMGVEGFEEFDFSSPRISTGTFAKTVYNRTQTLHMDHLVEPVNSNGVVVFSNLQCGLYLIAQETKADGYRAISPFLVSVPLEDESDGKWIYDVDAQPKSEAVGNGTVLPDEPDDPDNPDDSDTPDPGDPNPGTPGSDDPGSSDPQDPNPDSPGSSSPDTPDKNNSGNTPGSTSPDRPDKPNTSTELNIHLWSWVLGISLVIAAVIILAKRHRHHSKAA